VLHGLLDIAARAVIPRLLCRPQIKLVLARLCQFDSVRSDGTEIQGQGHSFKVSDKRSVERACDARTLDLFRNLRDFRKCDFCHAVIFGRVLIYGKVGYAVFNFHFSLPPYADSAAVT
jgi:hypothetical protein